MTIASITDESITKGTKGYECPFPKCSRAFDSALATRTHYHRVHTKRIKTPTREDTARKLASQQRISNYSMRRSPEQIKSFLAQVQNLQKEGKQIRDVCKAVGITTERFYKWRVKYGSQNISNNVISSNIGRKLYSGNIEKMQNSSGVATKEKRKYTKSGGANRVAIGHGEKQVNFCPVCGTSTLAVKVALNNLQ